MQIECPDGTVLEGIYLGGDLDGEFLFLDEELGILTVNGWTVELRVEDVERVFKQALAYPTSGGNAGDLG